jgi:hypothetical protein
MTGKEFKETGLVKLTDEELMALNNWLRRHSVATLDNASARPATTDTATAEASQDMRGFENQSRQDSDDGDIHGTLVGTFSGWNGNGTLFRLTNGMVWQQVESDTFGMTPTENAEIVIKKGFWDSWQLSVVGYKSSVRVKRLK